MNQNYNVDLKQKEENLYKENKELEEKRNEIKNKLKTKIEEIINCDTEKLDFKDEFLIEKIQNKHFEETDSFSDQEKDINLISEIEKIKKAEKLKILHEIQLTREYNTEKELIVDTQKQEISDLEDKCRDIYNQIAIKDKEINKLQEKGQNISESSKKFIIQITNLNEKLEINRKQFNGLSIRYDSIDKDNNKIIKEIENFNQNLNNLKNENFSKDEKIKELETLINNEKMNLKLKKNTENENNEEINKENNKLIEESKKLERQKLELLNVFKKQTKLIEILKKQKTHLELARSLGFSEDEFIKALDLNEKILN